MLLPLRFVAQRLQIGETRKNRLAKRLAFLYGAILFGVERGEQPLVCNGDDRRQRRIQGGAVGAAACRMRVPPKARSRRRGPQPVGSSASKSLRPCRAEHAAFASQTGLRLKSPTGAFMPSGHRRPFWFSFGAKREHLRRQRTFIKNIHVFQMQNPAEMKAASGLFWQGSQSKPAQNPKIRASAHFNTLKTYKSAKIFFYFLVRLLGGLRLLCGQNLLL